MMPPSLRPGTVVVLTAAFLRSTGQIAGGEGHSRWTLVACDCPLCETGRFVATDEPSQCDENRPRHIARANVCVANDLSRRNAI